MTDQYFPMVTVVSVEEHLAVESLTYAELLKEDGMEEEADVFALHLSSLRVATGIKPCYNTIKLYDNQLQTLYNSNLLVFVLYRD